MNRATEAAPSRKTSHVRGDGSFPRKRSPVAGDGCAADHYQPGVLLVAQVAQLALIEDTEAGDPGICNGPILLQKSKIAGRIFPPKDDMTGDCRSLISCAGQEHLRLPGYSGSAKYDT
jgi:hypothetical protein